MTTFLITLSACLAALTVYNASKECASLKEKLAKYRESKALNKHIEALPAKLENRIRNSKEYTDHAIYEAQTGDEVAAKIMLSYAMEEIEKGEAIIKELETLKQAK